LTVGQVVGQGVRQVGQVPRVAKDFALEMQAYESASNSVVWAIWFGSPTSWSNTRRSAAISLSVNYWF